MVRLYSDGGRTDDCIDLCQIKSIGHITQQQSDPHPYYLIEMINGDTKKMTIKKPPISNKQELKLLKSSRRWIKGGFNRLKL